MSHETIFNSQAGIIETKLWGAIPFSEVRAVIAESTLLAKENGCYLWLTDYSEATPEFTTLEIYDFPKLFLDAAAQLNIHVSLIKRAIVISKEGADYPFARTVAFNRGQRLELFEEIGKARSWLTGK